MDIPAAESMVMYARYVLIMLMATLPLTAGAHHSTAFYSSDFIELEGTLTRIDWINPHVRFVLRTVEPNGVEKLWTMEASATSALQRRGVSRELFRVGDRVRVAGHPSTRNDAELQLTNVLLPDGREASLWLDAAPRFSTADSAMIRQADVIVDAARENRGLFLVWTAPRPNPLTGEVISFNQPFTAAAIEARRSFDQFDNFATRCEPTGMPAVMVSPLPYEFIDRGATPSCSVAERITAPSRRARIESRKRVLRNT